MSFCILGLLNMLKPAARGLATALTTLLLTACGGGGGSGDSDNPSSGTPLSSANREMAAADALAMSVDGSLVMNLTGYFVPEAGAAASSLSGTATIASVASSTTTETYTCAGSGTVTVTSGTGTASWVYTNCVDGSGLTLHGTVSSLQLDADSYQGDFSSFSITLPSEPAVRVNGRLVFSSTATATELLAPQLQITMGTLFDLTMTNYLLRLTDVGTQTMIEAKGGLKSASAMAYDIRFDNTAVGDIDQTAFYLNDGDLYPVMGSLEIFDNASSSRITVAAVNNIQAYIQYMINGQTSSAWKDWGDLL